MNNSFENLSNSTETNIHETITTILIIFVSLSLIVFFLIVGTVCMVSNKNADYKEMIANKDMIITKNLVLDVSDEAIETNKEPIGVKPRKKDTSKGAVYSID